ncbi:hypothetical protein T492DRAFT_440474 [Pavlovales sp. CCMP2436]|nr:hypothetical protein T492DRAFT_440474 [Pavlovales sp. CCMP2436]
MTTTSPTSLLGTNPTATAMRRLALRVHRRLPPRRSTSRRRPRASCSTSPQNQVITISPRRRRLTTNSPPLPSPSPRRRRLTTNSPPLPPPAVFIAAPSPSGRLASVLLRPSWLRRPPAIASASTPQLHTAYTVNWAKPIEQATPGVFAFDSAIDSGCTVCFLVDESWGLIENPEPADARISVANRDATGDRGQ